MSGRVVFLWLAVLLSLISGREFVVELEDHIPQTVIADEYVLGWERPVSGSPSEGSQAGVEESVLATASESEEESSGSGSDGLVPLAILPIDAHHQASARRCTISPVCSRRPVTRLRC